MILLRHPYVSLLNNSSIETRNQQQKSVEKPWLTKSLLKMCKKKNILYRNFIKCKTTKSECRYKKYRNTLTAIMRNQENDYDDKIMAQNKYDMKNNWKH